LTALVCQCNDSTKQHHLRQKNTNGTQNRTRNNSLNNRTISRNNHHGINTNDRSTGGNSADKAASSPKKGGKSQDKIETTLTTPGANTESNNNARKNEQNRSPKNANAIQIPTANSRTKCQKAKNVTLEQYYGEHLISSTTRKDIHDDKPANKPKLIKTKDNRNWTSEDKSHQCGSDEKLDKNNDWILACSSLCPWDYVINRNIKRYPVDLHVARCNKNKTCGSALTRCEEVFFNVPVLLQSTKCNATGHYIYEKKLQRIVVGCTCANKPT